MPQYLDHHPTVPNMPPELVAQITQRLVAPGLLGADEDVQSRLTELVGLAGGLR